MKAARTLAHPAWNPIEGGPAPALPPVRVIEAFVLFQLLATLALISPISGLRVAFRMAAFGSSIAMLFFTRAGGPVHPARNAALVILAIVSVQILHPNSNTLLASLAQLGMYVAILGPLFWVPRLDVEFKTLRRALLILWGYHTLSAALGVLQVYMPGVFQPRISPMIVSQGQGYLNTLMIVTSGGRRVLRPMGLSDIPGGAAISGLYAVLLGMGFFLTARGGRMTIASITAMMLGLLVLYLSQIRALLVTTMICVFVVVVVLVVRGERSKMGGLSAVVAVLIVISFKTALSVASSNVGERVGSLITSRPSEVYYSNRGKFLEYTIQELLPRYPFGAGLGRWGMMAVYFGDNSDPTRSGLWAELQWTGWLFDGGLPLIIAYSVALALAFLTVWNVSREADPPGFEGLGIWAMVLLGYIVGITALMFSYPVFMSQTGLEFWLLTTLLFAVAAKAHPGLFNPRNRTFF
jgi:hypothetical protein